MKRRGYELLTRRSSPAKYLKERKLAQKDPGP
jgi:hypothetical protein